MTALLARITCTNRLSIGSGGRKEARQERLTTESSPGTFSFCDSAVIQMKESRDTTAYFKLSQNSPYRLGLPPGKLCPTCPQHIEVRRTTPIGKTERFLLLEHAKGCGEVPWSGLTPYSHTNRSKESLGFSEFTQKWPPFRWALEHQYKRSRVPVDLTKAHWTPPLTPKLAFEVERNQIETVLGLTGFVALTDHDTIAARVQFMMEGTTEIPFALEWTVPFGGAIFHLGIHNLPSHLAQSIVADLVAYTQNPCSEDLSDLIAMLDHLPEVLIVFNHPLWDFDWPGTPALLAGIHRFLAGNGGFLHAFEVNAMRSWKENEAVIQLAHRWQCPIVSGGDRHGCEPSGALNLTCAQSFSEFVDEVRKGQLSHIEFMPQYSGSRCMRTIQTLLDVIREYPEFPAGSRRLGWPSFSS